MLSHAKLLQSHPTLCGPMDCSLPDSARDSPGKNTGGGCHALLQGIFSTRDRTWSLMSPALAGGSLSLAPPGKPLIYIQFSSVTQLCPTLCDPMNRSTPGLPVHHQLPEFTQTQVHRVSDAIQPSHPRLSPSPPAPKPSQHQSYPMSQDFT